MCNKFILENSVMISKTQQMCDKFILENSVMIMFIPDCYKDQNKLNNVVADYAHASGFLTNCYKTQKMCDKAVSTSVLILLR